MTSKKLFLMLIGVNALLIIAFIGGAYVVNSTLTAKADKLTAQKAKSQALVQQNTSLNKAKKDMQKYAELNKIAKAVVPEDKDQAQAVREIVNIAGANNVALSAINFPASSLGNTPAGTPATSSSTVPKAVVVNPKAKSLSQLLPVKSIPGVYQLPITVVGDSNQPVQYSEFLNFLTALENNRRTAQVASITLTPAAKNRDRLVFTLTINEYIKP